MADEDTSQPSTPAPEQAMPPQEAATTPSEPETPTAQIPADEPFDSTHDKPTPAEPEPPETDHDKPTPTPESAPEARRNSSPASAGRTGSTSSPQGGRDLLVKARATIQQRKQKKLEKILEALDGKGPTTLKLRRAGKIINDEVEKLLHVSDATATRYLSALEKDGKIKQIGKTGKAVEYTKV